MVFAWEPDFQKERYPSEDPSENHSLWQAILSPAYVFPLWSKEDSAY
ncbi:unnamed protein product, partial [marine sediment metagenome]